MGFSCTGFKISPLIYPTKLCTILEPLNPGLAKHWVQHGPQNLWLDNWQVSKTKKLKNGRSVHWYGVFCVGVFYWSNFINEYLLVGHLIEARLITTDCGLINTRLWYSLTEHFTTLQSTKSKHWQILCSPEVLPNLFWVSKIVKFSVGIIWFRHINLYYVVTNGDHQEKPKETTLERADFTLQLLMFVTAEKERECL